MTPIEIAAWFAIGVTYWGLGWLTLTLWINNVMRRPRPQEPYGRWLLINVAKGMAIMVFWPAFLLPIIFYTR